MQVRVTVAAGKLTCHHGQAPPRHHLQDGVELETLRQSLPWRSHPDQYYPYAAKYLGTFARLIFHTYTAESKEKLNNMLTNKDSVESQSIQ